ncbi:MAG: hypothetical protein ACREEW_03510 [Caulobacteraceae bacterium]
MRYLLNIDRILVVLLGLVWILQGVNVLPGSFMSGHMEWAVRGAILVAVFGLFLALSLVRWKRA